MNTVAGVGNNYLDMVQMATRRNTLVHVAQASQAGTPLDVALVQSSNQQLRENARETGVELYTQNLQMRAVETYTNGNSNNASTNNNTDDSSSGIYTFDASQVNETLQMAQRRAVGVAAYENLSNQAERPDFVRPATNPVNVYV